MNKSQIFIGEEIVTKKRHLLFFSRLCAAIVLLLALLPGSAHTNEALWIEGEDYTADVTVYRKGQTGTTRRPRFVITLVLTISVRIC